MFGNSNMAAMFDARNHAPCTQSPLSWSLDVDLRCQIVKGIKPQTYTSLVCYRRAFNTKGDCNRQELNQNVTLYVDFDRTLLRVAHPSHYYAGFLL